MDFLAQGRLLRMLRIRRRWRQSDVAARAGIARAVIGRHENGDVRSLTAFERHGRAFGLRVRVSLVGRGGELDRLRDEEHAAIVELVAGWLRRLGLQVEAEVSFNEWGERGRVDILGWDQRTATVILVEVKSALTDLQDLFGSLDVRERLTTAMVSERGWVARRRLTLLVLADSPLNRRIVRTHPELFAGFARSRLSRGILDGQGRLLCWVPPGRASRGAWNAARQRVRTPGAPAGRGPRVHRSWQER